MNETLNLFNMIFKHNFSLEENTYQTLEKHIHQLPFPSNLKIIKNNK